MQSPEAEQTGAGGSADAESSAQPEAGKTNFLTSIGQIAGTMGEGERTPDQEAQAALAQVINDYETIMSEHLASPAAIITGLDNLSAAARQKVLGELRVDLTNDQPVGGDLPGSELGEPAAKGSKIFSVNDAQGNGTGIFVYENRGKTAIVVTDKRVLRERYVDENPEKGLLSHSVDCIAAAVDRVRPNRRTYSGL